MAIKITVVLINTRGPFHWSCQHVGAIITDLETERSSSIEFGEKNSLQIYSKSEKGKNPLYGWTGCCVGTTDLYSDKDFDTFIETLKNEFSDTSKYDWCSNNCADAVSFAINEACPEKTCTEVSCCIYKLLCCPLFFGSLGLSCFAAPPGCCTTPQDIYDKAKWLAKWTSYGTRNIEIPVAGEAKAVSTASISEEEKKPDTTESLTAALLEFEEECSSSLEATPRVTLKRN